MSDIFWGGVLFAIIVGAIFIGQYAYESKACGDRYGDIGETRYGVFSHCQVKVGEQWVPSDRVRVIENTNQIILD